MKYPYLVPSECQSCVSKQNTATELADSILSIRLFRQLKYISSPIFYIVYKL